MDASRKPYRFIMKIGKAIKLSRSSKGMTLNSLSEKTGLSPSYLSMLESEKRKPTLEALEKISNSLSLPLPLLVFLAAEEGELKGLDSSSVSRLSGTVLDLLRAS
jgi:transcriptional regulator with XRE-family HTH domain